MIEWFAPTGKPIHTLLTKCDKLTRQESINALRATKKAFAEYTAAGYRGELTAQLFSALKRVGLDEAHEQIESWLIPEGYRGNRAGRRSAVNQSWPLGQASRQTLMIRVARHKKTRRMTAGQTA